MTFGERLTGYFGGASAAPAPPVTPNPTSSFLPYNNSGTFDDSFWFNKLPTAQLFTSLIQGDITKSYGFAVEGTIVSIGDFASQLLTNYLSVDSSTTPVILKTVMGTLPFGFNTEGSGFLSAAIGDYAGAINNTHLEIKDIFPIGEIYPISKLQFFSNYGVNGFYCEIGVDISGNPIYSDTKFGDFGQNQETFIHFFADSVSSYTYTKIAGVTRGLFLDPQGFINAEGYYLFEDGSLTQPGIRVSTDTDNVIYSIYAGNYGDGFYFDYNNNIYYYGDKVSGYFFNTYNDVVNDFHAFSTKIDNINYGVIAVNGNGIGYVHLGDYNSQSFFGVDDYNQYLIIGSNLLNTSVTPTSTGDYLKIFIPAIGVCYLELFQ